jgi:hypothetical protein
MVFLCTGVLSRHVALVVMEGSRFLRRIASGLDFCCRCPRDPVTLGRGSGRCAKLVVWFGEQRCGPVFVPHMVRLVRAKSRTKSAEIGAQP